MIRSFLAPAALALFLCGMEQVYAAPANPLITVDENGIGTLQFPGSPAAPLAGFLAPDPGPGGLPAALTYNLLNPGALVAGDLLLQENAGAPISEVIRFNPAGTGGHQGFFSLVFYSDRDGDVALADTGLPTALYANTVFMVEVGPPTVYTPGPNDPGFVPGFAVSYAIDSDVVESIPEPASLTLLGIGIAGLAGYGSRRRKQASA